MYHKDSNNKRITQINRHFCGVSTGIFAVNISMIDNEDNVTIVFGVPINVPP